MSQRAFFGLFLFCVLSLVVGCNQTTPTPDPINKLPTAAFEATPTEGFAPLTVQFDASKSIDPDGKIADYSWSFGDTASESGSDKAKVSHTYSKAGQYKATLVVKDEKNATDDFEVTITVKEKETPPPPPPKDVTFKTENEYVVLERTFISEAKVGETFSVTLKATAKVNLGAILLSESDGRLPANLTLVEGLLKGGGPRIDKDKSVEITYKVKASQEGKPEVRGRALILLPNGDYLDLPLTTKFNIVK